MRINLTAVEAAISRRFAALALVVASLGAMSAVWAGAASAAPRSGAHHATRPLPARIQAKVRQTIRKFQHRTNAPGVLIGIWSPRGTFVSATGVADLKTRKPLRTDMQFKIASQTKSFTENVILQLVGEGRCL